MPSTWLVIDSDFPSFRKDTPMKEQVSQLQNYMVILVEQLRFQLTNLNVSNWNDTAVKQFQKDTTKDVTEKVEEMELLFDEISGTLESLAERVGEMDARCIELETNAAWMEQVQEEQAKRLEQLEDQLTDAQIEIDELRQRVKDLETVVVIGEDGVTIGDGNRPIRLVGEIYINGVKLE